jgi:hypothetical protein
MYLAVVAVGAALAGCLFSRDRRWLRFAWQIVKYTLIFALGIFALLALERLFVAV